MRYCYLYTDQTDPYQNLARERCLLEQAEENTAILFLWQNADTIVIGRNQDAYAECRAEEFLKDGGRIARRCSGGGAVYHDMGNLNISLIGRKSSLGMEDYLELVTRSLHSCDIRVEYNGRNDLLAFGKKFSGNACYERRGTFCCHGTILVHTDTLRMGHFLTPDVDKLARNRVKSVGARVGNLSELCPGLTVKDICEALIHVSNAKPLLDVVDGQRMAEYTRFFQNREWIFGGKR